MNADIITLENQIQMDERQSRYFFINNMGLNSFQNLKSGSICEAFNCQNDRDVLSLITSANTNLFVHLLEANEFQFLKLW